MTIVTGATGFVGSHLLDRLADSSAIVAWYRPGGRPPDPSRPVDWQAVDLADGEAVAKSVAATGPARIYHLGGSPYVGSSWQNATPHLRANALGTHHILDAVRRAGRPCRVLVVSSAQVYQSSAQPLTEDAPLVPMNPYGLSKLAADQLALRSVREDGLDVVLARPFNHAGPRQSALFAVSGFARQVALIEAGLSPPVIKVGDLTTRRDFTDVRDVVQAYQQLLERAPAGRPFNVCSGRAWQIGELLDTLIGLSSASVRLEQESARLRPNDTPLVQGDPTRIRSELGWTPERRMEDTLADTLDYWRTETRQKA